MGELLFLAHRIPYPPAKGDKIRSWHFLEHLAARHRVHLGCFVDDPDDWPHVPVLRRLGGECRFEPMPRSPVSRRTLAALLGGAPLSVGACRSRTMTAWAADVVRRHSVDRVFVFSSAMAQHAPAGVPRVIDFVDVDSDKWSQYAATASPPASWIYRREARLLLDFDRRAALNAAASLFVAEAEAALFRRLAPDAAEGVRVVPNGVDLARFAPDPGLPVPDGFCGADIVFTGAMDYRANVDAVVWFARDILGEVRRRHPQARFWIVGSSPSTPVRRLEGLPGVRVTGRVDDVRPFLAHAAVVVAPLRLARGTQNKVLEAMAMGRPVVATPAAARGIAGIPDDGLRLAETAPAFADAVAGLLDDPARAAVLAHRARQRVADGHDWGAAGRALDALLFPSPLTLPAEV